MLPSDRYRELEAMLRPAGGGVHVVSTGLHEQRALQRAIYGAANDACIVEAWKATLRRLPSAKVALLGVPSDCGAGFVRGANQAPGAVRRVLLETEAHPAGDPAVVDLGDVFVVPHLLSEEMVSDEQKAATRTAIHGDAVQWDTGAPLPVSPLGVQARVLEHVRALAPGIVCVVLGGDHSVAWPAFAAVHRDIEVAAGRRLGLLHFDAHTDLLPERLGVRYCFATWAYHANDLLGRSGRLVQVGIRASGRSKAHWESTLGVRQYWPDELDAKDVETVGDEIIARFEARGVEALYVSNDIDGTDSAYALATGTPEAGGPPPAFVRALTQRLTRRFPLVGGDLVEVAPPLGGGALGEPERTLALARDYLADLLAPGLVERP